MTAKIQDIYSTHKRTIHLLALNLIVTFIVLSLLLLRIHFATDSYYHAFDTADNYDAGEVSMFLSRAIYTNAFLRGMQLMLGANIVLDQRFFYLIMIVATAISITMITRVFSTQQKQVSRMRLLAINAACLVAFVNPFMMEFMLFAECALFIAVGNLLIAISVWLINKTGWRAFVLTLVFLIFSLGVYQAYLGVYFALASSLLWLKHKNSTKTRFFFRGWVRIFAAGALASVVQVIYMKLYSTFSPADALPYGTVSLSVEGLINNALTLIEKQPYYYVWALGRTLAPLFCIMLLVAIIFLVISLRNLPIQQWATLAFALITSYCSVFAIHMIATTLWAPFRSVFGFWTVIVSFLLLPTLLITSDTFKDKHTENSSARTWNSAVAILMSVCFFTSSSVVAWDVAVDNYKTNTADSIVAQEMNEKISRYEERTGKHVTQIAMYRDTNPTYIHPEIRYAPYESSGSALAVTWALPNLLNIISNRGLTISGSPDLQIYNEFFSGKNWDAVNLDEQLVFSGDTAYYCSH